MNITKVKQNVIHVPPIVAWRLTLKPAPTDDDLVLQHTPAINNNSTVYNNN